MFLIVWGLNSFVFAWVGDDKRKGSLLFSHILLQAESEVWVVKKSKLSYETSYKYFIILGVKVLSFFFQHSFLGMKDLE